MLMLAPGAYGGLEHRASTALSDNPFAFATRKEYEELLELLSHEYFHCGTCKRIRPRALGPSTTPRETYTAAVGRRGGDQLLRSLHAAPRRLQPAKRYLEKLAEEWGAAAGTPGRKRQSLEESSFDAWIKLYRPDENT